MIRSVSNIKQLTTLTLKHIDIKHRNNCRFIRLTHMFSVKLSRSNFETHNDIKSTRCCDNVPGVFRSATNGNAFIIFRVLTDPSVSWQMLYLMCHSVSSFFGQLYIWWMHGISWKQISAIMVPMLFITSVSYCDVIDASTQWCWYVSINGGDFLRPVTFELSNNLKT